MAYLIPKSARNVKLQLFKGMGIVEVVIAILATIGCYILFTNLDATITVRVALCILIVIVTIFLVSPSFIVNKKGYQTFGIIFSYMYQIKQFKNKRKGKK